MSHNQKKSDDISPLLAALCLAVILFILIAQEHAATILKDLEVIAPLIEANIYYFGSAVIGGSVSFAWLAAKLQRTIKLTKQGSRLHSILGRKENKHNAILPMIFFSFFSATVVFFGSLLLIDPNHLVLPLTADQRALWNNIQFATSITLAIAAYAFVFIIKDSQILSKIKNTWSKASKVGLPPFPSAKGSIVLGSTGENVEDGAPQWVSVGTRGLNGNILITGSIGGGKTQGTILPFFDQLLANLEPKPSVLAIDPKGTFIPVAEEIAKKNGLEEKLLVMSLDGSVRFNPIYHPDALKGSRFLDIAFMVKAAGSNFMGRSADSAFWEMSSFNLIKNSLVYCAAVHGYYTLIDLYEAMLRAVEDRLPEELQKSLMEKSFDDEQRFNVMRAHDYFALEFKQMEDKVRTGILATATSFLNQFQEYRASRIFCPKQDEQTFQSMDEVVDSGRIFLFDIESPALAKSMGTIIKLLYQDSLLERLKAPERGAQRTGLLIIDEYQDVVTTGHGASTGDERFLAKSREANAIAIVATQSLTSLQNSIGRDSSAKELYQNFRTRIAGHSSDLATIQSFQELVGQEDREKLSHSLSELSQDARKNYMLGGFEANNANISESVSKSTQKEFVVTGREFSSLGTFECFALVYDGMRSSFMKLFLKPYFLADKATLHSEIMSRLAAIMLTVLAILGSSEKLSAFPNVCSVVKAPEFSSCLSYSVSSCTCGFPPRPCAHFSYYVPQTFIEVHPNARETFFGNLPAARGQLSALNTARIPYGTEGDGDTQSFHSHTLAVPLASTVMNLLPCSTAWRDTTCFEAMSEHLGTNWSTGAGDNTQPSFLAWMASPKGCLMAGAARSLSGGEPSVLGGGSGACSIPMMNIPIYPPSAHSVCNGWGIFFPRVGVYEGPSQTAGALMVASRMKSLATEVFQSTPSFPDEKWQMILPQSSSCFREGENLLPLETVKRATEWRRLAGGPMKGHLFTVWQRVSCCKDLTDVATGQAALSAMKASCQAAGGSR